MKWTVIPETFSVFFLCWPFTPFLLSSPLWYKGNKSDKKLKGGDVIKAFTACCIIVTAWILIKNNFLLFPLNRWSATHLCSSIETRRAFTRLTCSCRIWWAGRPASGCSDTRRPRPPLRSCRCRPSCPQQYRDSESCVPRRWDPYGEWWFERAGRRVGLGEGARHSCDPDNTQRKTVASSNNGCSGKKGKRKMETNENEGKKKTKYVKQFSC